MTLLVWLLIILQIKHFLLDFVFQPPYMWRNKGTFGHPGGIIHSGIHAWMTFFIITFLIPSSTIEVRLGIYALEFMIHYMTDWSKMNINRIKGWDANKNPEFWYLTGLDQLVHQLTYLGIVTVVLS